MNYEVVIGLEVHVELATASKIFCGCTTAFGGEPNTHCCPVCTGMPGTLPVLNKMAVEYTIAAGLATNCNITRNCQFDRKNYFYPDLPKAYQVSQLYLPICTDGHIEIDVDGVKKTINIREIHMEEDAGKLIHDPWADATLVDYNRCGVPLIEIVSQPDMRSAKEVLTYLQELKSRLEYLGVSDCKMQEGSMRADVNVSVNPVGAKEFGTRTEMKNMNSFKAIARAIEFESKRQMELLDEGKRVVQQTRRWDDNKGVSLAMRSKENAQDYRYFPEPDLTPICISQEWIDRILSQQPELPEQKRLRYISEYSLPQYDTNIITTYKALADLFEETVALTAMPKEVSNWIMGDLMKALNDSEKQPEDIDFSAKNLAKLIKLVDKGAINRNIAKKVFLEIFEKNIDPEQYVQEHGLQMVNDTSEVKAVIETILANNPQSVADFKSGKEKAFGFLVGQAMRELRGKADPALVNQLLKDLLK